VAELSARPQHPTTRLFFTGQASQPAGERPPAAGPASAPMPAGGGEGREAGHVR